MKAWAECYSGSGRFTGRLADEPVYQANGDVAPGWANVASMTEEEFNEAFEQEEHDHCHSYSNADRHCPHCVAAGWIQ